MGHLKDAEEEAESDMTPMIDAVFLLIIFFLCIDFKTLEAKLPSYLPKDKGSQATEAEPVEQLSLKIIMDEWGTESPRRKKDPQGAFMLADHEVHWMLGPKRFDKLEDLLEELEKIFDDPNKRVPDKDKPGQKKPMSVVIEPQPGTTYGDVASTVDTVSNAGFPEINFGGGRGLRKKN